MDYRSCAFALLCIAVICAVSGMPKNPKKEKTEKGDKRICMDMSTECDRYINKTYLCQDIKYGQSKCRKTCGLCSPDDYTPSDDEDVPEPSCMIEYVNKNVTYPDGMDFTIGCATCTCSDDGWGCTDIHCDKFDLPSPACKWNPPQNPERCCSVPFCPSGIEIEYPAYWIEH